MSQDQSKGGHFEVPKDDDFSEAALKPFGAKRIGNKIVCRADESLVSHEILPGEPGYDHSIPKINDI